MKVYPSKVEAVNGQDELVFTATAFDQYSANIDLKQTLHNEVSLEEMIEGLRKAFTLLELDK